MAGKALEDVTALNKCSACGKVKRAHLLCPYCVKSKLKPTEFLCEKFYYKDPANTLTRHKRHVVWEGEEGHGGQS